MSGYISHVLMKHNINIFQDDYKKLASSQT